MSDDSILVPILAACETPEMDAVLARPWPMFWVRGNPPGDVGDFMKELGRLPDSGPVSLEDALLIAQEIRLSPQNDADTVDVFLLAEDGHTMTFVARVMDADPMDQTLLDFQNLIEQERGQ